MRIILQNNDQDCLLACYSMILSHYHIEVSLFELYERDMIPPDGLSVNYLKNLNQKYGLAMNVYKAPLNTIVALMKQEKLPLIAQWNDNHFVVIKKITKRKVKIIDPALGEIDISHDHFKKYYTNHIVVLKKETAIYPLIKRRNRQHSILALFLNKGLVFILISLFFSQMVVISFSVSIQHLLDGNIMWYTSALIFTFLCVLQFISFLFRWKGLKKSNEFYEQHLSKQMFQGLFSKPLLFFRNHTTGSLMEKISLKSTIRDSILFNIVPAFINFFSTIVLLVYLFVISAELSFITMILLLIYSVTNYFLYKKQRNANIEYLQNNISLSAQMQEDLTHIDEIKALSEEEKSVENWSQTNHKLQNSYQELIKVESISESFNQVFNFSCLLTILVIGMLLLGEERITFASLILFQTGISLLTGFIGQVQNAIFELAKIKIYREKQTDILVENKRKIDVIHPESDVAIEIKGVSYGYERNKKIFDNITFKINKGEKVAILGASGSGKSTLLNILLGLYEYQGEISYGISNLRDKIGVVLQGMTLKKGSIYNNLTKGTVEETDFEELQMALQHVNIEDVIERLPKKIFSNVFQNGKNLSGGQIQRLLIAKSLINNTELIFWDEAFSSLDNKTRAHIYKFVLNNQRYKEKTIVMISHHVDIANYVDKIIFLEEKDNKIHVDTHKNLLETCIAYQNFFSRV